MPTINFSIQLDENHKETLFIFAGHGNKLEQKLVMKPYHSKPSIHTYTTKGNSPEEINNEIQAFITERIEAFKSSLIEGQKIEKIFYWGDCNYGHTGSETEFPPFLRNPGQFLSMLEGLLPEKFLAFPHQIERILISGNELTVINAEKNFSHSSMIDYFVQKHQEKADTKLLEARTELYQQAHTAELEGNVEQLAALEIKDNLSQKRLYTFPTSKVSPTELSDNKKIAVHENISSQEGLHILPHSPIQLKTSSPKIFPSDFIDSKEIVVHENNEDVIPLNKKGRFRLFKSWWCSGTPEDVVNPNLKNSDATISTAATGMTGQSSTISISPNKIKQIKIHPQQIRTIDQETIEAPEPPPAGPR